VPIVTTPLAAREYRLVLFSLLTWRDFYALAEVAEHKREGQEWIAGGNAVTNPTGIRWALDYVFLGDAFESFPKILRGERSLRGLLRCASDESVEYNEEPPFPLPFARNQIILSKGCRRRCLFCSNAWRSAYAEQKEEAICDFLRAHKGRGVYLCSNSSDDVTYYEKVTRWLEESGKIDLAVSFSISGLTEAVVRSRRSETLLGVEGMSARLRSLVNKPVGRERLRDVVDLFLRNRSQVRTVYQFNLPTETVDDWREFEEDVAWILSRHRAGSWAIPFIPHQPTAMTPLQWSAPRYSMETARRIMSFRSAQFGSGSRGVSVFVPAPLYPLKWLKQILAEWVPVTPALVSALAGLRDGMPLDYYVAELRKRGFDLAWIFEEKPADCAFPWDCVRLHTDKATMRTAYERAFARGEASNG
jgi:hypothetical protein